MTNQVNPAILYMTCEDELEILRVIEATLDVMTDDPDYVVPARDTLDMARALILRAIEAHQ